MPRNNGKRKKGKKTSEMSDADKVTIRDIIYRSVMGKSNLWPIHPFPAKGSLEDRFNAGDNQILLWAIADCAQNKQPIPEWATDALTDLLYRAVQGDVASWDNVFGKIFRGVQKRRAQTLSRMLDVYYRVCELSTQAPIDNALFKRVGKELNLTASSKTTVQELYLRVKAELESQSK